MSFNQEINDLLNKKMDRQSFIKHLLIVVVSVSGLGFLLRSLNHTDHPNAISGYSGGAYGGHEDKKR